MAEDSESKTQGHHFQFIKTHGLEVPRIYIPIKWHRSYLLCRPLKDNLKQSIKIVKVDLELYHCTFVWEINGQRLVNDIKISFSDQVAIACCVYKPGDTVQIVQYFRE